MVERATPATLAVSYQMPRLRLMRLLLPALALPVLLGAQSSPDTARATRVAVVGEDSPGTPTTFGEISGFAFDAKGRLYVTDFKELRAVVLDTLGRQLATIGRSGKGPGEFEAPTGPAFGADGSLFVRNMKSVMRFDVDPTTGIASRYAMMYPIEGFPLWRSKRRSVVDGAGSFAFPRDSNPSSSMISYSSYIRYARDGKVVDTIRIPTFPNTGRDFASYRTGPNGGRMVRGLAYAPFESRPSWTITAQGTVIAGDGSKYDLQETDSKGRSLRRFTRALAASAVPPRERAESAAVMKRRIDSLPVPVEQLEGATEAVKKQMLPSVLPAFIGVESASDGTVWVRRWPPAPSTTVFDVFAASGTFQRTVLVPAACNAEPRPVISGTRFACLVVDTDTGAETILLARIPLRP
jgi:hypothetical protein